MITLQGMRLNQKGYILYLTSATVEDLSRWFNEGYIFADIWKRDQQEGYQRMPNKERFKKIADYLENKLQIEETLLPNTIIFNIRQKGTIDFEPIEKTNIKKPIEIGKILIYDEALPFREVDGQHRVRGLIEAYKELREKQTDDFEDIKNYPIPLTIIEGLDRPEEAMQFVVINTTQKRVDPALVLRILHKRYRDKSEKLEFFLKGQTWRLYAVDICETLNTDPNSPWCDKIIAPGDDRKGRVISEQNFVNSLETLYSSKRLDPDIVRTYLPLYWRAIEGLWPECVGENASKYSLQRTNGINAFHWLFPFIYFKSVSLGNVKLQELMKILKPIHKKYGPSFWERGGEAKGYTSRASQATLADKMIAATLPGGKELKLSKINPTIKDTKEEKSWLIAEKLLPLRSYYLFKQEKINNIDSGATGVYSLYSFTKQKFYVGRSEKSDLKSRLQTHFQNKESEFHIFNYRLCKEPKEAHDLECALYHLLPIHLKLNKEHPSSFEGRECPFCVA